MIVLIIFMINLWLFEHSFELATDKTLVLLQVSSIKGLSHFVASFPSTLSLDMKLYLLLVVLAQANGETKLFFKV